MGATTTNYDAILKDLYTVKRVEDGTYPDKPLYAMMKKTKKFGGRQLPIPVIYGHPQGVNSQFSNAQTGASGTATSIESFNLTRVSRFGLANVTGEVARATMDDDEAFVKAMSTEIDKMVEEMSKQLAQQLYRSGYGMLGVIGSTGTSTAVLDPIEDITSVEIGQVHCFADTEAGDTLHDSGDTMTVIGVDRDTGTITYGETIASVSGLAAGDYIFLDGDRQDSATPARRCIAGLEAWFPATAPDSTSFFGVDRSVDPSRLAGQRKDLSSLPLEEVLIQMGALVGREGGKLTHVFLSWTRWAQLQQTLQARGVVNLESVKVTPQIGFSAINYIGASGPIRVIADQFCPANRIWGLNLEKCSLYSIGEPIRVASEDGLQMIRLSSSDGYESRWVFHGNFGTGAPWNFINAQV